MYKLYKYISLYNWGSKPRAPRFAIDVGGTRLILRVPASDQKTDPVQDGPSAPKWMPWGSTGVHNEFKRMLFRVYFRRTSCSENCAPVCTGTRFQWVWRI